MATKKDFLKLNEKEAVSLLAASVHLGAQNRHKDMEPYVYDLRPDGVCILNLGLFWEKLNFAARAIIALSDPKTVCLISSRPFATRGILKFARYASVSVLVDKFVAGTLTNKHVSRMNEPRLALIVDPVVDHQAISECSKLNVPIISICGSDTPLSFVDIAIPANNRSAKSIGTVLYYLCRQVLRMRGQLSYDEEWSVMPDEFIYRDSADDLEVDSCAEEEASVEAQ